MIKKIVLTITFLMVVSGLAWAGPMIIKFGTVEPPQGWATVNVVKPFLDKVEGDSGGTVKFEMYTGGTLGRNPTKYLKMVRDGIMDIGWIINAYQPGRFPDDAVANAPFTARNPLEGSIAINHMLEKGAIDGYDTAVPLGVFFLNQYAIHTTFPVKKPEDLKGVKLRVAGKMQHKMYEALGGTPVGLPITKVAESISRGVIKGIIVEWNALQTFRVIDLTKYHCMVPFGSTIVSLVMNKKVYAKLPPKALAAFKKHQGFPLGIDWGEKQTKNENQIMEKTKNNPKHHVYVPTPVEMNQWKEKMWSAVEVWKKEHPKGEALLKSLQTEIAKARAQ